MHEHESDTEALLGIDASPTGCAVPFSESEDERPAKASLDVSPVFRTAAAVFAGLAVCGLVAAGHGSIRVASREQLASNSLISLRRTSRGSSCHAEFDDGTCKDQMCLPDFPGTSKEGSCKDMGYQYCYTGAYGIQGWANADGCSKALKVMSRTGYKNDGCAGEGLACPESQGAQLLKSDGFGGSCHAEHADGTCKDQMCVDYIEDQKHGSCRQAGFEYCFTGAYGIQGWTGKRGCAKALTVMKKTGYANDGCDGEGLACPDDDDDAAASAEDTSCHAEHADGTCNDQMCVEGIAGQKKGSCQKSGYAHCFTGAYGITGWANATGCTKALEVMKKTGYKNDGCEGEGLACPATPGAADQDAGCHAEHADGTCNDQMCMEGITDQKKGSCKNSGYNHCYTGAYGTQAWANKAGCAKGLEVMRKTGYKNDGCHGEGLACPESSTESSSDDDGCHTAHADGTCKDQMCLPDIPDPPKKGSCKTMGYKYCFKGAYSIQSWANQTGCATALSVMQRTGQKNDGCDGEGMACPATSDTPGSAAAEEETACHDIDLSAGSCHEVACYLQQEPQKGSCAKAGYEFCWTGAYSMKGWANEQGCTRGLQLMKRMGFKNDGCGGVGLACPQS